jgi:glycerol-3-phosphate dehydrogenase
MRVIPNEVFHTNFDVVIIGGGINGAGIALDAASRGFKVLLLEKNDFGSGTTSASTKLIHGGLRYLEYFEVGLVRESLREREILLKNAPHLVKPLSLVFPVYKHDKRSYGGIRVGLIAYDVLSYDKSLARHKMIKSEDLIKLEPNINHDDLIGGAMFYDCQVVYPERLCLENIVMARKYGAIALNYTKVVDIKLQKRKVVGLTFLDVVSNLKYDVACEMIVNVAGPWVDSICQLTKQNLVRKIGGTKGSHIVVRKFENAPNNALYFSTQQDNRPIFVIPWRDYLLIGTTDSKHEGPPDDIIADTDEVDYLLNETKRVIPGANLSRSDILYTYSGIRPLPFVFDLPEDSITRKHMIFDHEKNEKIVGLISIIGGKITTYRSLAKETVSLLCSKLHHRVRKIGCKTEKISFFGAEIENSFEEYIKDLILHISKSYNLSNDTVSHLLRYYGLRAYELIDLISKNPELSLKINPDHPDVIGQIIYSMEFESAETAIDILLRRTTIGTSKSVGLDSIEKVSEEMGKYLHWGKERIKYEIDRYYNHVNTHYLLK